MRMITGFETVTEGKIIFYGKVINNLIPQKREYGIVFQFYALFPNLTVEENIAFGLKVRKMPQKATAERVVFPLTKTAFFSNAAFFFMRAMTPISAVIFLVSARVKLAAIEIIFLDIDGRTASANAMCTIIIVTVIGMLLAMRVITGKSGMRGMSPST